MGENGADINPEIEKDTNSIEQRDDSDVNAGKDEIIEPNVNIQEEPQKYNGRNRRVRQKNRYFLDFHCIDLTKGGRSSKDDYDTFTTSTHHRSNRGSNSTNNNGGQDDDTDVFETKYCRKCSAKTCHDNENGCQSCVYKKIVEASKKQKSSSQRSRSNNTKSQPRQPQGDNNKLDSWTPDEVAKFMISKGFVDEAELFKTQSVDGISLLLMQRADFTYGLKIKLGPALKIYDQVCKLKREYFRDIPIIS